MPTRAKWSFLFKRMGLFVPFADFCLTCAELKFGCSPLGLLELISWLMGTQREIVYIILKSEVAYTAPLSKMQPCCSTKANPEFEHLQVDEKPHE